MRVSPCTVSVVFASVGLGWAPARASLPSVQDQPMEELRAWLANPAASRSALKDQSFAGQGLTRDQAKEAGELLWKDRLAQLAVERKAEWDAKAIGAAGQTMKFDYRLFGEEPKGGRSMFISMHGGGNAPADVNDQQWRNQIGLYTPPEGIYIAPRAPTNTWNLWHEGHIDPLFDRLIEDAIVFEHVNPDRVYLMGYSAGGDGVYQLAPRMADRFAAAAMMAGHPNEASPVNLRNLPFVINVGANDDGYGRNKIAAEWGKKLDDLHEKDPGGYTHDLHLREGMGHWMKKEDASAIPWMMQHTRNPIPARVVWRQDDVLEPRLYWLAAAEDQRKAGAMVAIRRDHGVFEVEAVEGMTAVTLLLNDEMCNLDQDVRVVRDGAPVFEGKVVRTIGVMAESLGVRADPGLVFSAKIDLKLEAKSGKDETSALLQQMWPVLTKEPVKPIAEGDRFTTSSSGASSAWRYKGSDAAKPEAAPAEKAFENDDDAVALARSWIREHFGELPGDQGLAAHVLKNAREGAAGAKPDSAPQTTIFLEATYKGMLAEGGATVQFKGRSVDSARGMLFRFIPTPGSEGKVIDSKAAIRAWQDVMAGMGAGPEQLARLEKMAKPKLRYAWASSDKQDHSLDEMRLTPVWLVDEKGMLKVDALTGKAIDADHMSLGGSSRPSK